MATKKPTIQEKIRGYVLRQVNIDIDDYRDDTTRKFDKRNAINVDYKRMPRTAQQAITRLCKGTENPRLLMADNGWMMQLSPNPAASIPL